MKSGWFASCIRLLPGWLILCLNPLPGAPASLPFANEAYIWQRAWTPPLIDAIHQHGREFSALTVLAGEINFQTNHPTFTRVLPDYATLAAMKKPIAVERASSVGLPFRVALPTCLLIPTHAN